MIETSIIIPTQNDWYCIKACIDAIVKHTENYEIIFVVDERVQFSEKLKNYGKVVHGKEPFVFSERINAGSARPRANTYACSTAIQYPKRTGYAGQYGQSNCMAEL